MRLNTGTFDPMLGRSYGEIAIEGRSLHRSQGEGRIEPRGDQFSSLTLIESTVPKVANETSPFDGIDTTLAGISKTYHADGDPVSEYTIQQLAVAQKSAEQVLNEFDFRDPSKIVAALAEGHNALNQLFWSYVNHSGPTERIEAAMKRDKNESEIGGAVFFQIDSFSQALRKATGLQIDALADAETVVPGESLTATARVYLPKNPNVTVKKIELQKPNNWTVNSVIEPTDTNAGGQVRRDTSNASARFRIDVPRDAAVTQPYWLAESRDGDLFRWSQSFAHTRPFDFQPLSAVVTVGIDGKDVAFTQPLQYRYADPSRGEIRREINVVPALSVGVDHGLLIVPQSDKPQTRKLSMSVTNNSGKPVSGIPGVNIPAIPEWKYTFDSRAVELKTRGEKKSVSFDVTIPAKTKPGLYHIYPNVMVGESLASSTMNTVAYPHIQTHRYYTRAETLVNVLDLKISPVRVGYIMGSGDEVPEAIRQMGLSVTMLDEKDLTSGDLSKFDTIVVGIRATETRPDFIANNQRLLDWVKSGGSLIMQYQRGNFAQRGVTPFPVDTTDKQGTAAGSIARVVDENAAVKILEPTHSVFNFPNKIGDEDFKGWVQERNAYNLVTFDQQYTPLLESHDAGEAENKGGLVMARLGKGTWTYCSYSFFRQLPNGVGGAYRLFANLLSLPKAQKPKAAK